MSNYSNRNNKRERLIENTNQLEKANSEYSSKLIKNEFKAQSEVDKSASS